jgi:opacity protein-like surface antigen
MMQSPPAERRKSRPACAHALLRAALALAGMAAAVHAHAQREGWTTHPALQDRWAIQIGVYSPSMNTTFQLNGSGGLVGTQVSAEDDLGLRERNDMPALLASMRAGERWRIEAEYLSLRRENSRSLSRTINWGDNSYTIGTTVSSDFKTEIYRFSVGYSFIRDARRELGVALGVHATDILARIAAASVGSEEGDVLAPLPTIGVYGAYALSPKWLLAGRVDVFSLSYEEYDGALTNVTLGADYRIWRNFGLGAAYRYIDYDLSVTKSRYNGSINYRFSGPLVYLVTSF